MLSLYANAVCGAVKSTQKHINGILNYLKRYKQNLTFQGPSLVSAGGHCMHINCTI